MTKKRANPAAPWSREKGDRRVYTADAAWAIEWIEKLRGACHPKQLQYVDDGAKRITVLTSRGGGKSTSSIAKLLITMGERPKMPCLFIATTREQATEIVWGHLKDIVGKLHIDATFSEVRRTMTFPNGSTLRLCGADDRKEIDKLRGLAFAGVVIDEAASHPASLLENLIVRVLGPRLGEHDGWIALVGTPGHELAGTFYDASRPGSKLHRPYEERGLPEYDGWLGWSSHRWTLEDGAPYVPAMAKLWAQALIDKQREQWSDTHPIWLREYRATWAADNTENVFKYRPHTDDGAPFNQWDPERVGPYKLGALPAGLDDWMHVVTFDKGFTDNFAVNVFAFSATDPAKQIYHRYCFERPGFYARRLAELLLGTKENGDVRSPDRPEGLIGQLGSWPVGIEGDTDEAFISELANVYGIRATAAIKRRDYKFGAIELTNGDLVDGRIKILKDTPLEAQLLTLQWDPDEFGMLRENKAQANHSTDCLIYGRRLIARLFESGDLDELRQAKAKKKRGGVEEPPEGAPTPDSWSDLLASGSYGDDPW